MKEHAKFVHQMLECVNDFFCIANEIHFRHKIDFK